MKAPFTVYMVLSLVSLGLLALLLPFVLLPSSITGVPAREFGIIHASAVVAALAKSAFVILEILIEKQTTPWSGKCDVDAAATALLTMAIVTHFPLLAVNTHFKVTTRDNPPPKLFSTMWSVLFVFFAYAIAAMVGIGLLVTWGADSETRLGAWITVHCVATVRWWRVARIVTLFIPLALTIIIAIPCVLSVTIRHHLFRRRDITRTRIEVGMLVFTSVAAMVFLITVWAKPLSEWPRPLEGALGILVFLMVLSGPVVERYCQWLQYINPFQCCVRRQKFYSDSASTSDMGLIRDKLGDEEARMAGLAGGNGGGITLASTVAPLGPMGTSASTPDGSGATPPTLPQIPLMARLAVPSIPRFQGFASSAGFGSTPGSASSSLKSARRNRILPRSDMKEYIRRIRPVSAISVASNAPPVPVPSSSRGRPRKGSLGLGLGLDIDGTGNDNSNGNRSEPDVGMQGYTNDMLEADASVAVAPSTSGLSDVDARIDREFESASADEADYERSQSSTHALTFN